MCGCNRIGKRRIGKINLKASTFTPALGITAGFLLSKKAESLLDKIPVVNTSIGKTVAKALLGVVLSGNKRGIVSNIGTGMIVGAAYDAVGMVTNGSASNALRLINGLGEANVYQMNTMANAEPVKVKYN